MSQSSAHPGRPVDRIWTEALRAFARPVAVLAGPRPEWRRLVGQQEVDGLLLPLAGTLKINRLGTSRGQGREACGVL